MIILEKTYGDVPVIVHRGVDKEAIAKHVENPHDTIMIVYSTAKDFLDNLIELEIFSSHYLAYYQIYEDTTNEEIIELVEKWCHMNTKPWIPIAGIRKGMIDKEGYTLY
jgi:hypothetical protein